MMFPVRINVLSYSKKAHLRRLTLFTYLKSAFTVVFSLISILAALLLVAENYFINYRAALTYRVPLVTISYHEDITQIEEASAQLKKIDRVQKNFILWSPRIDEILTAIPPGIQIQSMILDHDSKLLSLAGIAQTREALALCEKNLKSLPSLDSVKIPLGELTRKEDIPFTVEAVLK